METMAPLKLWICLAIIGCVLIIVTVLSVHRVASSSSAITAIRIAHLDLFWAKIVFRDPAVHQAEFHLNEAWSSLRDRDYDRSVLAAREAIRHVNGIKIAASAYSNREDKKASEPGSAPET